MDTEEWMDFFTLNTTNTDPLDYTAEDLTFSLSSSSQSSFDERLFASQLLFQPEVTESLSTPMPSSHGFGSNQPPSNEEEPLSSLELSNFPVPLLFPVNNLSVDNFTICVHLWASPNIHTLPTSPHILWHIEVVSDSMHVFDNTWGISVPAMFKILQDHRASLPASYSRALQDNSTLLLGSSLLSFSKPPIEDNHLFHFGTIHQIQTLMETSFDIPSFFMGADEKLDIHQGYLQHPFILANNPHKSSGRHFCVVLVNSDQESNHSLRVSSKRRHSRFEPYTSRPSTPSALCTPHSNQSLSLASSSSTIDDPSTSMVNIFDSNSAVDAASSLSNSRSDQIYTFISCSPATSLSSFAPTLPLADTPINPTPPPPLENIAALADSTSSSSLSFISAAPTSSLPPNTLADPPPSSLSVTSAASTSLSQDPLIRQNGKQGTTLRDLYHTFIMIRNILIPLGYSNTVKKLKGREVYYLNGDHETLGTITKHYLGCSDRTFEEKARNFGLAESIGRSRWAKQIPDDPYRSVDIDLAHGVWLRMLYLWGPLRWIDRSPDERSEDVFERRAAELRQNHLIDFRSEISSSIAFGSD
ncbi:hypothetical protein BDP27DRAFT_1419579 [Rhodocollybia butyracea]|uniref:Uncharacterized protein n=1 Tax=Rhodocollybia butyracea TaxID=206335 RepID=A0A9P5PZ22_9AGAR|nr:hypothetical protein BDP27DRAFT_1419579 [Rhodocollybia butyracea]